MLVVSLVGLDATFSQSVHARHVYLPHDVVFDHHFDDMIEDLADGRIEFDFRKFHDIHPLTPAQLEAEDARVSGAAE